MVTITVATPPPALIKKNSTILKTSELGQVLSFLVPADDAGVSPLGCSQVTLNLSNEPNQLCYDGGQLLCFTSMFLLKKQRHMINRNQNALLFVQDGPWINIHPCNSKKTN